MESRYIRIAQLINLYLEGAITSKEMEELLTWQKQYPQIKRWIEQKELRKIEVQDLYNQYQEDELLIADWEKIVARKDATKGGTKRTTWIIAASVATLFFAGIWGLQNVNHLGKLSEHAENQEVVVRPGKEQAFLTLSDGSTVLLDNQKEQVIQEGSLDINLLGSHLDYTTVSKKKSYIHKLSVPTGGTYFMRLSDGTKVWLNAETELEFPSVFIGEIREVKVKGEAYFEVAKNPDKPFVVNVGDTKVTAIGTAFNINTHIHEGMVKTILTDGKIEVAAGGEKQVINPGYAAISGSQKLHVEKTDLEEALALKDGYFYFNGKNFREILGEVSRWYGVELKLKRDLNQETYRGGIKKDVSIESVCDVLEDLTGYEITINKNILTIK